MLAYLTSFTVCSGDIKKVLKLTTGRFQSFFFYLCRFSESSSSNGSTRSVCLSVRPQHFWGTKKVGFEVKHAVSACFCHVIVSQQKLSAQKHNTRKFNLSVHAF